jgi:hypothetical protein
MKTKLISSTRATAIASRAASRKSTQVSCLTGRAFFAPAVVALVVLTAPLTPPAAADTVTDWNEIMQRNLAAGNAPFQARAGAIVQLAVFDAVNSITGDYEPYLGTIAASPDASPEAAVIAAAHRVLVAIVPANVTALNAARTTALAALPDGPAKDAGIAVGEAAAAAMLQWRANDGWAQVNTVPYTPGTELGEWRPSPPAFASATFTGMSLVTPFGLEEAAQFRPPPPPGIQSGIYARDLEEVKLRGNINAPAEVRPQDRTDVARFVAAAAPTQVWNPAARQVSAAQSKTLSENARIFALLNMAIGDASIASFEAKYFYNFWRPQTAIMAGEIDGNPRTSGDLNWRPLISTPTFPSYPSAHATLSTAAATVLDRLLGNHGHDITLMNPTLGITLHYTSFREICDDVDDARVYGGIHFRFDQNVGGRHGQDIGRYMLDQYLRPLADDAE